MILYPIVPVSAPRQGRRDSWKPSPHVLRYRAFRDLVAAYKVEIPDAGAHLIFLLPMPASWSKKKRAAQLLEPHLQKPDADNLAKALIDAVYRDRDDSHVWDYRATKLWAPVGGVIVSRRSIGVEHGRGYLLSLLRDGRVAGFT